MIKSKGISLIELLIGIAVSSIVLIGATSSMVSFYKSKNMQSGIASAQAEASIVDYMLTDLVANAGYGLPFNNSSVSPLKCGKELAVPAKGGGIVPLFPVLISRVGDSDQLSVSRGSSSISGQYFEAFEGDSSSVKIYTTDFCQKDDYALVVLASDNSASCAVSKISGVSASNSSLFLESSSSSVGDPFIDYSSAKVSCISSWSQSTFRLTGSGLSQDILSISDDPVSQEILSGVVAFNAQYGVSDSATSNQVTAWVDATGSWASNKISTADLRRIKAIRYAMVLRASPMIKDVVSFECDPASKSKPSNVCIWTDSDSPETPIAVKKLSNWNHYKYRTVESTISLDNILWNRD